jgi:hypothetical protein
MYRLLLCSLVALLCLSLQANASTRNRSGSGEVQGKKLIKIELKDEPVKLVCQSFGSGDDWLKDLNIDLENISGRAILEIEVVLVVKGDGSFEHPIVIPLERIIESNRGGNSIPNGGKTRLLLAEYEYQKAKAQILRTTSLSSIDQAELLIRLVNFGTGGWYRGADYLQGRNRATTSFSKLELPSLGCNTASSSRQLNIVNALPQFGGQITEPIKITGQKFSDGEDWLRGLEVEIENTSKQSIDYIELIVLVCDIKNIDYCISIPLRYPALGEANDANLLGTKPILPGARVKLTVAESAYQSAKTLIEQVAPLNSITVADLIIGQVNYLNASGGWINQTLLRNFAWELYKPGSRAFTLAKDVYIWGYLRNRDRTYSDMYLGMEATRDETELEYIYDENGQIRSVRIKGTVRKGGGYIREYEKERDRARERDKQR